MAAEMAAMLDQLMGPERNVALDKRTNRKRHHTDADQCKFFIAGLSPVNAFKNTKSADDVYRILGDYDKRCDEDVKAEYDQLSQEEKDKLGYEYELWQLLERLVGECDKRVARAAERVTRDNDKPLYSADDLAKQAELKATVAQLNTDMETAAEEGDVDAAQELMGKLEVARSLQETHESRMKAEKTLAVCQISGVYMSSTDNEQRTHDHLNGKQYLGWKSIRAKLEQLRAQKPPKGKGKGGGGAGERDVQRSGGDRDRGRDRSHDHGRERDHRDSRDYRRDDRSRERDSREYRRDDRSRERGDGYYRSSNQDRYSRDSRDSYRRY